MKMKMRRAAKAGLFLGACLIATSASAKPKLRSINALAQALAAKLPSKPGILVYVAPPIWNGKDKGKVQHDVLCAKIRGELASDLSAADPKARIITPMQAESVLAQHGRAPLDAYLGTGKWSVARMVAGNLVPLLGTWARTEAIVVIGEIREGSNGLELTVNAVRARGKSASDLSALLAKTPQLQALFAAPDVPIRDSAGTYLVGIGGVGTPTCFRCISPRFARSFLLHRKRALFGNVWLSLTVGANGKVSKVEVVQVPAGRGWRAVKRVVVRTLLSWKFRPATGPDGKPVTVSSVFVEMSYRHIT